MVTLDFFRSKYFFFSLFFHIIILLVLILGLDYVSPMPVIENTNKNDVISAVILGDTPKSKILPKQTPKSLPKEEPSLEQVQQQHEQQQKLIEKNQDVIALNKVDDKKKKAEKKLVEAIKQPNLFAKDLLSDIKKQDDLQKNKQKKLKQKQLQTQFQKTLRQQAEQSLRQQLLNEEIKLQSTQVRQSQGEVNKYKALILQKISEKWIIPTQANKKLYCELMIRVAPGGMVLDVQITKTSGDPSLDKSARAAVMNASPLPVPSKTDDFEAFRQFVLKVKPENVLNTDVG